MKEVKLIVAGGRDFDDYSLLCQVLRDQIEAYPDDWEISIVSGMARGTDSMAVAFAREHGAQLYEFPANWETHGKVAGFIRNQHMAEFGDLLIAFWDGSSRGTAHMIKSMEKLNKPTTVIHY